MIGFPGPLDLVSDEFGPRIPPVPGASSFHRGMDFGLNGGDPIYCAEDGVVLHAGPNGGEGYSTHVRHNPRVVTKYFHARAGSLATRQGDTVSRGQTLGLVGSTGTSGGNHLHWEVHLDGYAINPRILTPIDSLAWKAYAAGVDISSLPIAPLPKDLDMLTIYRATDSAGYIFAGWTFLQQEDGTLRALSALEFDAYAWQAAQGSVKLVVIEWAGNDLLRLARQVGLWEFVGESLEGPRGLTGRLIGRNAPIDGSEPRDGSDDRAFPRVTTA